MRTPGHRNHWIAIDLEGVKTNRSAIGAKVAVAVREGDALRTVYRTGYGSSFGGTPLRQHIGIGGATRVEAIEITWPESMTVQKFQDLAADQFYQLRESDAKLTRVERKIFAYKHLPEAKHQHSR